MDVARFTGATFGMLGTRGTEGIEDAEDKTEDVEEPPGSGVELRRSSSDAEDVSDSRETRDTLGR